MLALCLAVWIERSVIQCKHRPKQAWLLRYLFLLLAYSCRNLTRSGPISVENIEP